MLPYSFSFKSAKEFLLFSKMYFKIKLALVLLGWNIITFYIKLGNVRFPFIYFANDFYIPLILPLTHTIFSQIYE